VDSSRSWLLPPLELVVGLLSYLRVPLARHVVGSLALFLGWLSVGSGVWAQSEPTPEGAEDQVTLSIRTSTAALGLKALVEEALRHNLEIQVSRASLGTAQALYEQAAAQAYPKVTGNMLIGGPTAEAKTTVRNDINTVTDSSFLNDGNFGEPGFTFRTNVQLAQPIYTFEKIGKTKEAANHLVDAAHHQIVVTQGEVVLNVHKAFWACQLTRSFERSLIEGQEKLRKVLRQIEDLLDNDSDQVTENDRLRLVHALSILEVRLTEARAATSIANQAMKLLVGRPQHDALDIIETELSDLPTDLPPLEDVLSRARIARPELRALRALVQAQTAFAEFRANDFFPEIFVGGLINYAYTSNATNQTNPFIFDPFNFFDFGLGLGVRFDLDVFNKMALLERAEAEARVRSAQAALATQAIDLEIRRIYVQTQAGFERVTALERANRAGRSWLTAAALGYDVGTGDARELIDAFLAWAASEAELERTRFDTHIGLTDLARASGDLVAGYAEKDR
jgi:outer membrane protein